MCVRIVSLTKKKKLPIIFAGYPLGYSLDPYVVLYPTAGGEPSVGYWVQQTDNGSTGFLQLVRLVYWLSLDMLRQRRCMFFFFRWLIFFETLCDPWSILILIKAVVCINWCRGIPHFKKKKKKKTIFISYIFFSGCFLLHVWLICFFRTYGFISFS
jgi:hypothetical protein